MAVVLSALVLIGYTIVQVKFFPKPQQGQATEQTAADAAQAEGEAEKAEAANAQVQSFVQAEDTNEPVITEQQCVIETKKARVTFTNKGGDIVGYELLDHKDNKTGRGVEMAENVTASNRAFALNFGGTDGSVVNDLFVVKEFPEENGEKKIAFAKKYSDFTLVKQYTFKDDDYMFKMNVVVDGGENFTALDFAAKSGGNASYTLRTSPQVGPQFNPKVDRYESRSFIALNEGKGKRIRLGTNQYKEYNKPFNIAGIGGKYFCELVIPAENGNFQTAWYSTNASGSVMGDAQALLVRKPTTQKQTNDVYYVYVGPRNEKDLKKYLTADANAWKLSGIRLTDALESSGFLGWLEAILKFILETLYKFVHNWGISIILMTIILKIALFPLTMKSSLGTLKMQEMQPKLTAIQNKYKDNPQMMQAETAKVYQAAGYNPMSGCLPMIFQMLCLFAMYNLFNNYFEFRGASFIKGWIDDLSDGDSVYQLKTFIPLVGNHIRVLPVIYLVSQLFYGKITQMGGTLQSAQSSGQMKFMTYGLPLIFFFLFYNAPSGLILFWTVSNVIQMIQQVIINKTKLAAAAQKSNVVDVKAKVHGGKKRK
ncbi:MAG: membrane protein insertase YidC, partial [Treponema sp.]|nr:membrane protein insertase YidC [Treponema sp.]